MAKLVCSICGSIIYEDTKITAWECPECGQEHGELHDERPYVGAPEAATMLGIGIMNVNKMIHNGVFQGAYKSGGTWFIPRKSVEAVIEARNNPQKTDWNFLKLDFESNETDNGDNKG